MRHGHFVRLRIGSHTLCFVLTGRIVLMASSGPKRRFPTPWRAQYKNHGYDVEDANGFRLASVYCDTSLSVAKWRDPSHMFLTRDEARRIANGIVRLPEFLNRHHPAFEASDNPQWSKSHPYHVALANAYVQENYDRIASCCARNAVPFERTGGVIEIQGGRWCVYKFARQIDAIRFWDAFDGRWMRREWFIYPERPKDLLSMHGL